jgi:basic amino acid/polyamine antiporter, APA family
MSAQPDIMGPARPKLKRSMGLWMATALVIGNMIGSGVFGLPSAMAQTAGPLSILAWIFTGAGAILLALVFAKLGRAYPRTGGPYAYARHAFGDFIGFQTAWGYWIAVWVGNAAIATIFVSYASNFWPSLGESQHHWLQAAVALGVIWLLTAVNVVGVREGGLVQLVTTVLKFVPLVVIGVIGLFFIKSGNFTPFAPYDHNLGQQLGAISTAGALVLWAFLGLESATVPAEEVKDPERNVPRATVLGTVGTTLVYLLATVAIMGILPTSQLVNSNAPFADAAQKMWGGSILGMTPGDAIALVAMISTFGALNGWILLQGRVPLAAAEDRLFPKQFGQVLGTRRTPAFGLIVSSVLLTGLVVFYYSGSSSLAEIFNQAILLATLTTLVPYAFSAAAQLYLMFTDRELFDPRTAVRDSIIALLAFAFSFWMIWGAGESYVAQGFLLLMAGIPVYVYMKWRQSGETAEPAPTVPLPEIEPAVRRLRIPVTH